MSHISCVQTLVKASGKKSSNVFFLPKLLLSFTSTRPEACLDLRLKSGALVPTGNGIRLFLILDFSQRLRLYFFGCEPVKRRLRRSICHGPGPRSAELQFGASRLFPARSS